MDTNTTYPPTNCAISSSSSNALVPCSTQPATVPACHVRPARLRPYVNADEKPCRTVQNSRVNVRAHAASSATAWIRLCTVYAYYVQYEVDHHRRPCRMHCMQHRTYRDPRPARARPSAVIHRALQRHRLFSLACHALPAPNSDGSASGLDREEEPSIALMRSICMIDLRAALLSLPSLDAYFIRVTVSTLISFLARGSVVPSGGWPGLGRGCMRESHQGTRDRSTGMVVLRGSATARRRLHTSYTKRNPATGRRRRPRTTGLPSRRAGGGTTCDVDVQAGRWCTECDATVLLPDQVAAACLR
jgi:hypothetical protein